MYELGIEEKNLRKLNKLITKLIDLLTLDIKKYINLNKLDDNKNALDNISKLSNILIKLSNLKINKGGNLENDDLTITDKMIISRYYSDLMDNNFKLIENIKLNNENDE